MGPKRSAVFLIVIFGTVLAAPCHGTDQGSEAVEHVNVLRELGEAEFDARWDNLARYVVGQLELIGVKDLRIDDLSVAADTYFPGRPISTWRPIRGVLSDATTGTALVSLETAPGCVARPSSSVRLRAEVVDVGAGIGSDAYLGKEVVGKLALSSGDLASVYREAVLDRGAVGVISYFEDELERGILDPEQLPQQVFVDEGTGRAKPDTFAITVLQGTALDMRRALLRGQQMRLSVDVEVDARKAEVQSVTARVLPSVESGKARQAQPLLLFSDLGVGREHVSVGGAAALLEVAAALAALNESGSLEVVRPVVFLWSSDPAAVRSFVSVHEIEPIAALELRNVGVGHTFSSVIHLVVPPGSHATWLSDWAGAILDREWQLDSGSIDDQPSQWLVHEVPFDADCDPFLLNRSGVTFPTLLVSGSPPCGSDRYQTGSEGIAFDEVQLDSVIAATLQVVRPMVTGEQPSPAALNRMGGRLLTRHWLQALNAFKVYDDVLAQGRSRAEAMRGGLDTIDAARFRADAQLDSWRGSLPEIKTDEFEKWIEAVDGLMRDRMAGAASAATMGATAPRVDSEARDTKASTQPPPPSPAQPTPVAITTPTPQPPTPRPTAAPPPPATPTEVPRTPTPAIAGAATAEAETRLANGRSLYEDGRCVDALAELERIGDRTPEQHEQARVLITVIEKRMELSRAAYRDGLTHLAERRNDQALTSFQRVVPCTEEEYRQAQNRIRSIQASASRAAGTGACESLGVLRATRAQGDGRTVRGSLKVGEKIMYCFGTEMPGYGDLEVLVPMGFRAEGAGLVIAQGFKTFSDSDKRYVRYYAEKLTPRSRVEVTLLNKQSTTEEFECEFYLYPR